MWVGVIVLISEALRPAKYLVPATVSGPAMYVAYGMTARTKLHWLLHELPPSKSRVSGFELPLSCSWASQLTVWGSSLRAHSVEASARYGSLSTGCCTLHAIS